MEVKKADVRTQGGGGVCRNSFRQSAVRFPAEIRQSAGRKKVPVPFLKNKLQLPSDCRQICASAVLRARLQNTRHKVLVLALQGQIKMTSIIVNLFILSIHELKWYSYIVKVFIGVRGKSTGLQVL